jgi:hypothetical protein
MYIYRAKTYYHLMIILLYLKEEQYNVLYIEDSNLVILSKKLVELGFFKKVIYLNDSKLENIYFRMLITIYKSIVFQVLHKLYAKNNMTIITPQHNIHGKLFNEFIKCKNIILLEDGQYSYKKVINNRINSLYTNSIYKKVINKYFLTIYNPNIEKFIFCNKDKLSKNLGKEFKLIKNKIKEINIDNEILNLSIKKRNIFIELFFNDMSIVNSSKSIIILTQPNLDESIILLFEYYINKYLKEGYMIFLKEHPREDINSYDRIINKYNIKSINKFFPFELLLLLNIEFNIGITYNSTAIFSDIIKTRIIIGND